MTGGVGFARTALAGFNPLALSSLLWFIHTDDSTLSAGNVSAINDRLAGYTFAQGTGANRPVGNTTEFSGHTVWDLSGTGRRYLSRNGAPLAGALDGAPAYTFGAYAKVVDPGGTGDFCGHTDNLTSYANSARFQARLDSQYTVREVAVAGATNYQSGVGVLIPTTNWHLLTARSDGAGTLEFFLDGVLQASVSGTHRSPAGMTDVVLGEAANNSDATKDLLIGGLFCFTGQLSAANMVQLSAWYAASFA